jgi:hypothetical protein
MVPAIGQSHKAAGPVSPAPPLEAAKAHGHASLVEFVDLGLLALTQRGGCGLELGPRSGPRSGIAANAVEHLKDVLLPPAGTLLLLRGHTSEQSRCGQRPTLATADDLEIRGAQQGCAQDDRRLDAGRRQVNRTVD